MQWDREGETALLIEELIPDVNLETTETEFKGIIEEGVSDSGKPKEIGWLKTIAAFANSKGGKIYIGVDNKTHRIMALEHTLADKTVMMIHRQIRNRVEPSIDYEISSVSCPDTHPIRYVLCVEVRPSKNLPVVIHEEGLLGIYIRIFGETVLATPEQVRELILMSENTPYDRTFTALPFHKKDFSRLFQFLSDHEIQVTDKELISIGFMSDQLMLSRGALLFKDDCKDLRTKAVATAWPGLSKGSSVVNASEEYVGDLLTVIQSCFQFIRNRSNNGFIKQDDGRADYVSFPSRSVLEGIVNAVGHRNYFIQGTQIEINLFQDRLEIISPGSLLGVQEMRKEKNIAGIIPRRRNEVICAVLEICRYMEEKGSGFDKIAEDYSGYPDMYQPYVSSDVTSFTLTLPDLTYQHGVLDDQDVRPEDIYIDRLPEGKNDLIILAFCYGKARSVKEIAQQLGLTASSYFRKSVLQRLADQGYLTASVSAEGKTYLSNPNLVRLKS